jgi:hypothetical protein
MIDKENRENWNISNSTWFDQSDETFIAISLIWPLYVIVGKTIAKYAVEESFVKSFHESLK